MSTPIMSDLPSQDLLRQEIPTIKFTCAISNQSSRQDYVNTFENGACLADGHGTDGAFYAIHTCSEIEKRHTSGCKNIEDWSVEIDKNILPLKKEIDNSLEIIDGVPYRRDRIVHGGTTVTYISVDPVSKVMTVANAGDSTGYVFALSEGVYLSHEITANHKPYSKAEYDRLEALRQSGKNVGRLVWNTTSGCCAPIFDDSGKMIDYFSDHKPVKDTTHAYQVAADALELDPTNTEKMEEKKKSLQAYQEAFKASRASPTFEIHKRLIVGTVKGEYGCYLEGPKNTQCGLDTFLSCTVTIGDYHAKKVGARSDWDVSYKPLGSFVGEKRMIFVASDGVHDCFTEEELAKLVLTTESDQELLDTFVAKSKEVFCTSKGGVLVQADDISFFRADISHL